MTSLAERVRFAETYVKNKEGTRWSLKGREWVRDQYWLPQDGYKLWHPNKGDVCDDCKRVIGKLIEDPSDNATRSESHRKTGCVGLDVSPIVVTALNLIRQDGKTFNGMAADLADLALGQNFSIGLMAASEDQIETLLFENYAAAIRLEPKLAKRFDVQRLKITCHKTNGTLEAVPASAKSITGRTRRRVRIDEARDIKSDVAWAVIPAIQAMSGIECPFGHTSYNAADEAIEALNGRLRSAKCKACNSDLKPFFGRIVITSSSGASMSDDDGFWFRELVEGIEKEPSPYVHLFRSDTPINPSKSTVITNALESVFGGLESMRHHVEADLTNAWTRKGEDFLTRAEAEKLIDKQLASLDECAAPCIGFVDCATTVDKISFVVLAAEDPIEGEELWDRIYMAHLQWWDPKAFAGGVVDEKEIERYLERVIPMFSGLCGAVYVDVRGCPWAMRMVKNLKAKGLPVEGWDKSTAHESDAGWGIFRTRGRSQTIRLLDEPEIRKELRGIHVKQTPKGPKVVDVNRRKSHKDITEDIAILCYLIALEQLNGKRIGVSAVLGRSKAMGALRGNRTRQNFADKFRSGTSRGGSTMDRY